MSEAVMSDTQGSATTQATGDQTAVGAVTESVTAQETPWFSGIQDTDTRGWVETKGYKDLETAMRSHRELEKFIGVPRDKILTLPKDENDVAGLEKIHKALGRPDAPEGYKLQIPEGSDEAYAKEAVKWFHKAGLSQKQAETVVAANNEYWAAVLKQNQDAQIAKQAEIDAQSKKDLEKLTVEVGGQAKFEESMELARRYCKENNYDQSFLEKIENALGTYDFSRFMVGISKGMGEHTMYGVGSGRGTNYSPEGATAKRAELLADKSFVDRYVKGDVQAKQEMDKLERIIAGVK
jgi:hypothetical protein